MMPSIGILVAVAEFTRIGHHDTTEADRPSRRLRH
jgi:hypothetical protein